ncbi:MAG: potassium transporter [Desulforhopalus sp.]
MHQGAITADHAAKVSPVERIWVLGAGRFGLRAAMLLHQKIPQGAITLVDSRPLAEAPADVEFVCGDAVDWLVEHLVDDSVETWIIPAVPFHLAAEWLKRKIIVAGKSVLPVAISAATANRFPNPYRLGPSQLALSHADFLCPENCPEPEKFCTFTGQPRPEPLYRLLDTAAGDGFTPLVLRSRQFGAGVGGYLPADLLDLYNRAVSLPGAKLLVGTACSCHGIIDGLRIG